MKSIIIALITLSGIILSVNSAFASDPCLACHEKNTPGLVQYWKKSAHFQKQIGCVDCHGNNIEANHKRQVLVDAAKCGTCHAAAFSAHRESKHNLGLKSGEGCTRTLEKTGERQKSCALCHKAGSARPLVNVECAMFLAQTPEIQRQGCGSCHQVEVRCDTCHTKHGTDLSLAREPRTCGVCHMGPDHPQQEMWETSVHGVLYRQGGKESGPSCVTCHMRAGSHNISRGIASGLPADAGKRERELMLGICRECHTRDLAARNLNDADRIQEQSNALVDEAKTIIAALEKDGLLSPSPAERPPHPLFGSTFVIGPHMLYEDLSSVESLFFRMKSFYAVTAYKGAFHQNPDYAHWYGNAPMKLALSEIKSGASLLRRVEALKKRIDNISLESGEKYGKLDELRNKLRALKEEWLKGGMSDQEHENRKNRLLDEKGL